MKKYWKFLLMIGVSTVVMFGMMYLNVYALDHIFFLVYGTKPNYCQRHSLDEGHDSSSFYRYPDK